MSNLQHEEIKNFKELFKTIPVDSKKFKRNIEKSDIDLNKKKLLWAFYHYKQNDKKETFALLKGSKLQHPFYEGVRSYLLGLAQNHFGSHAFALEHLQEAVVQFKLAGEVLFNIYTLATIALTYSNKRDAKKMSFYLDELKLLEAPNEYCQFLIVQVEASYLILAENDSKARKILKKCLRNTSPTLELFKPSYLILLFNTSLKNQLYDDCYLLLDDYKKSTGFVVTPNYIYMKTLLDHIAKNKPLYIYEQDYEGFVELCEQLLVVKNLAAGDIGNAKIYWERLAKHNPELYKINFEYTGGPSLFLMAISLYKNSFTVIDLDIVKLKKIQNPIDRLHFIVIKHPGILKKAELIKLIWDEEISETSLSRLRKLIFNYKRKTGVSVESFQDTYSFKKAA